MRYFANEKPPIQTIANALQDNIDKNKYDDYLVQEVFKIYRLIPFLSKSPEDRYYRFEVKKLVSHYIWHFLSNSRLKYRAKNYLGEYYYNEDDFLSDFYFIIVNELEDYYSGSVWQFFYEKGIKKCLKKRDQLRSKYIKEIQVTQFNVDGEEIKNEHKFSYEHDMDKKLVKEHIIQKINDIQLRFDKVTNKIIKKMMLDTVNGSPPRKKELRKLTTKYGEDQGMVIFQYVFSTFKKIVEDVYFIMDKYTDDSVKRTISMWEIASLEDYND